MKMFLLIMLLTTCNAADSFTPYESLNYESQNYENNDNKGKGKGKKPPIVPEPSTYGAIIITGALSIYAYRKFKK